ncbi:MAG: transporter [Aquificaceae bacterium]|nr:transporter [Aquificaceae bacterium]MDW8424166.1 transporter [Aquificaceae bacterium]
MKKLSLLLLVSVPAFAHHGVASLGAVGFEGPGAPLETSSSATLPEGKWLIYTKLDIAKWKKYSFSDFPDQKDRSDFWMFGVGYGLKPWLSLYLFVPYNTKKELKEEGRHTFTSSDFGDISLMAVFGFKYDRGFKLVPKKESLEDMTDWHFTLYGGFSLPTGDANKRGYQGEFAPDMAGGFGKPTLNAGFTATKQLVNLPQLTFLFDTNYLRFFEHKYNTGDRYKFGDEFRVNTALAYRLYTSMERSLRFDLLMEANFLYLQKDKENGVKLDDTGGRVLYGTLGSRLYYRNASLGLGLKVPLWKDLNREEQQQGAEGKEKYRLILTFSTLF